MDRIRVEVERERERSYQERQENTEHPLSLITTAASQEKKPAATLKGYVT